MSGLVWVTFKIPYVVFRSKGKGRTKRPKYMYRYERRSCLVQNIIEFESDIEGL